MKRIIGLSMLACLFSGSVMAAQTEILTKRVKINVAASNKIIRANEKVAYSIGCAHSNYELATFDFRPLVSLSQYEKMDLSNSEDLVINGNATKQVLMKRIKTDKDCQAIVSKFEDIKNQVELTVYDDNNFDLNFR